MKRASSPSSMSSHLRIEVHESEVRACAGWLSCKIDRNLKFSAEELSSYCFAKWEPVVFDALLLAATIEFCDKSLKRKTHCWMREFEVRIPVHDPSLWKSKKVHGALNEALSFLTGDQWHLDFVPRKKPQAAPVQSHFQMTSDSYAVIPFSQGMDSRAVAGLVAKNLGDRLVRVRLGSKMAPRESLARFGQPFASVPYRVHEGARDFKETSARSRGFKFAVISGLAAYLLKAEQIIVPESGQGALGPALVPVGQVYADYRNHPLFMDLMEKFFEALLNYRPRFEFPRMWHTKGETLREFVTSCEDGQTWKETWSCWQQARQAAVDHRKRQCGVCAACMLRQQSVHAAGLTESQGAYVWEDLKVASFEAGAAPTFRGVTNAMREYAIAGTLHLDHLASLRASSGGCETLDLCAFQLSESRKLPQADVRSRLERMVAQHEREWRDFVSSLGSESFVASWAVHAR